MDTSALFGFVCVVLFCVVLFCFVLFVFVFVFFNDKLNHMIEPYLLPGPLAVIQTVTFAIKYVEVVNHKFLRHQANNDNRREVEESLKKR